MTLEAFLANPALIGAAVLVAIVGTGRAVRLVTYDDFPPSIWLRVLWGRITDHGPWEKLFNCLWCFGPWATAICMGWFFLGFLWLPLWYAWWVVFTFAAISYLVSMLVRRDEPEE
jgi:hypothetical protein